jgi:hypothetical protein
MSKDKGKNDEFVYSDGEIIGIEEEKPKRGAEPPPSGGNPFSGDMTENERDRVIVAVILIVLGGIFLLQEIFGFGFSFFRNWWAIFILIPGGSNLWNAYQSYQASGKLNNEVIRQGMSGVAIVAVALVFLFEISWGAIWPLFLIGAGLYMLLKAQTPDS